MPIAISDPVTGIISGTNKNSLDYFHEKAHLEFNKSNLGMNIQWIGQMSEFYTIISIALSFFITFFKYFSIIGVIIMIFCFTFEEIWCNYTAREKFNSLHRN